jgi:hypothetical protein
MALEQIREIAVKEADRADVQRAVIAAAQDDPERFLAAYVAHKDSFNGRYVCADLMKEMIPQFAESKESRGRYNAVVHNTAAVLAAEQYRRAVSDISNADRDVAFFVTGMPGAGKTSAIQGQAAGTDGKLSANIRVLYEGQLVDPATSIEKVAQALDAGCRVSVVAVLPKPEQALEFSFRRFEEYGRGAGVNIMTKIQEGTPDGLSALLDRFGDRITIDVHDVRDRANSTEHRGRVGIEIWRQELKNGPVKDRLTAEFGRRNDAGLVSRDCGRQFYGEPPFAEHYRLRPETVSGDQTHGDRLGVSQNSVGQNLLEPETPAKKYETTPSEGPSSAPVDPPRRPTGRGRRT